MMMARRPFGVCNLMSTRLLVKAKNKEWLSCVILQPCAVPRTSQERFYLSIESCPTRHLLISRATGQLAECWIRADSLDSSNSRERDCLVVLSAPVRGCAARRENLWPEQVRPVAATQHQRRGVGVQGVWGKVRLFMTIRAFDRRAC